MKNMKKIMAFLVMAVFLVSLLPMALAEGNETNTANNETDNTETVYNANNETSNTETVTDVREQIKEKRDNIKEKKEQIKEKIGQFKEINKENRDVKKESNVERKELKQDVKDKVKACKDAGNESVDCKEVRKELKVNVKARLLISADEMISLMENLKQKIDVLNPTDKAVLLAEVDTHIANVNAIKAEITALPDDATKEQYKAVTKKLKDEWDSARKMVRFHATRMVALGFGRVLDKAEKLQVQLDKTLAKLKEKGYDTSKADAKVAEFKAQLADARKSYDEANTLLEQYRADPSKENAVKAIQEKMNEAKKSLQEAQKSLREAVKEIKASGKDGATVMKGEVEKEDSESNEVVIPSPNATESEGTNATTA